MRELLIGGRRIAEETDTYVIADIGYDPWGDLERAEVLFWQAAVAGAHAVALTAGALYPLTRYEQADGEPYGRWMPFSAQRAFGRDEYARVVEMAVDAGLDLVPTAFDPASLEFLGNLGADLSAVRVEPDHLTDLALLAAVAKLGRPVLLGVHDASADQVRRAADTILPVNSDLALLQHTEPHPRTAAELNLGGLVTLLAEYPGLVIGFSGNSVCPEQSWIAAAVGARILEMRIPPDRDAGPRRLTLDPLGLVRYDGRHRWGRGELPAAPAGVLNIGDRARP